MSYYYSVGVKPRGYRRNSAFQGVELPTLAAGKGWLPHRPASLTGERTYAQKMFAQLKNWYNGWKGFQTDGKSFIFKK